MGFGFVLLVMEVGQAVQGSPATLPQVGPFVGQETRKGGCGATPSFCQELIHPDEDKPRARALDPSSRGVSLREGGPVRIASPSQLFLQSGRGGFFEKEGYQDLPVLKAVQDGLAKVS
jgi:hypothetical protein